jgi:tetratricopeptide (TPR) repeat protein
VKNEVHILASGSPAQAYAADLERIGDRVALVSKSRDAQWLLLASRLFHLTLGSAAESPSVGAAKELRRWANARESASSILEGASGLEEPLRSAIVVAELVEVAGGHGLAFAMLRDAKQLLGPSSPRACVIATCQQGRILRTLGAHERASATYLIADQLAREAGFDVGRGRAAIGLAAVAHQRGELQVAASQYQRACKVAPGSTVIRSLAELGLCALSLREGALKSAFRHGVAALHTVPDNRERRAEVLFNLAQVCMRRSAPVEALHAAKAMLRLRAQPRTRLLGLGMVAVAGARLGDSATVQRMVTRLRADADEGALPFATAAAWTLASRALAEIGQASSAQNASRRAMRIAADHGFVRLEADAAELISVGAGLEPLVAAEANELEAALVAG